MAWEAQIILVICIRKTGTQEFRLSMIAYDQAITQVVSSNMGLYSEQFDYIGSS